MKWFYSWFAKKMRQASEDGSERSLTVTAQRSIDSSCNGMNFSVYRANGGHVIETRKYDRKRDTNDHGLHIITDDKDLGEEIGRIITFENLRS